jgi:hypothetical protein
MRRTVFAAATVLAMVTPVAAHASALDSPRTSMPTGVRAQTCSSDGVASLCVSAYDTQDVVTISYQVTQMDGPGSYTVTNTNTTSGLTSQPQDVGPLGYLGNTSGTFTAQIQRCYNVTLVSTPGTSLTAGPVCG